MFKMEIIHVQISRKSAVWQISTSYIYTIKFASDD